MSTKNKNMYLSMLGLVAVALQVTAVSTDYWSAVSNVPNPVGLAGSKMNMHWGLWKSCNVQVVNGQAGASACIHMPPNTPTYKKNSLSAARVFAILGPLLVAFALSGSYLYPMKQKTMCSLLVMGAVSSLIATAIWGSDLQNPTMSGNLSGSPGYSFYLNLSGAVFALVAAYVCYQM